MNGLSSPLHQLSALDKGAMVNQTLNDHRIAVLVLQETHLNQESLKRIRSCYNKKMLILHSEDPDTPRTTAGVTFVINKSLINPRKVTPYKLHAGRALALRINWLESETMTLINTYVPNDRTVHLNFWEKIDRERHNQRFPCPDFLLGDFNVTKDPINQSPPPPEWMTCQL